MFRKVLIANRGEIAVRVSRTLREMGISSVAVYSESDRASLHVRMADEAAFVGPPAASESYLRIDRILDAARRHGAGAIHPGYGFLSENADFAEACEHAGIVFIGPAAASIRAMGSKTAARSAVTAAGVPVAAGTGAVGLDGAIEFARQHGYPVLLKAVSGGGGKGMRRVDRAEDLAGAFRDASSEAARAFRDAELYVEQLIERPRHIEIQVLGDRHGNLVHLGERECSIQRRHQKVIEECPSPFLARHPELRQQMGEAAVRAAGACGYYNAGTVEFLVDARGRFYFLEMNTRLQVEHPVTELATGLDLVRLQLEIAAGARLPFAQEDITWRGSALECRLYAEDPARDFFPCPGQVTRLTLPQGPGIRVDAGIYEGWTVPLEYDPLLAKLAVWAGTREQAAARMARALGETEVAGIGTNIAFLRAIVEDAEFRAGNLHTGFIGEFQARSGVSRPSRDLIEVAALAAALQATGSSSSAAPAPPREIGASPWLRAGRERRLG